MRLQLTSVVPTVLCASPRVASACPSCLSGITNNREAFFDTFLFLTIVPLVSAGLLVWWLVRRAKALDAEEAATCAKLVRPAGPRPRPLPPLGADQQRT